MVTVKALDTFPYDGITRVRGCAFQATPEDARILCLIGRAEYVLETLGEPVAEPRGVDVAEPQPQTRRTYRRRDVIAE